MESGAEKYQIQSILLLASQHIMFYLQCVLQGHSADLPSPSSHLFVLLVPLHSLSQDSHREPQGNPEAHSCVLKHFELLLAFLKKIIHICNFKM